MDVVCSWLNGNDFRKPKQDRIIWGVLRAVMAHLYIAWIHPFGDGNGRTARLVEFRMLVESGVPTPAAHLLSNHYYHTRGEYYRQLAAASASGGNVLPFIVYALQGFVDGLTGQLDFIREQQWQIAWRDFLHATLRDEDGEKTIRQRHLVLDLSQVSNPVPPSKLLQISARVALDYTKTTDRTLLRDVKELLKREYIKKTKEGYVANMSRILAFLPACKPEVEDNPQALLVEDAD